MSECPLLFEPWHTLGPKLLLAPVLKMCKNLNLGLGLDLGLVTAMVMGGG